MYHCVYLNFVTVYAAEEDPCVISSVTLMYLTNWKWKFLCWYVCIHFHQSLPTSPIIIFQLWVCRLMRFCALLSLLSQYEHAQDIWEAPASAVHNILLRSCCYISLHCWNDCKDAHSRDTKGKWQHILVCFLYQKCHLSAQPDGWICVKLSMNFN